MHRSKANSIFSELKPMASIFDELINDGLANVLGASFATSGPNVNIVEDDKGFVIELAAPGVDKSDFSMNLEQNTLKISIDKKSEATEDKTFIRREYKLSSFNKSFEIPDSVDRNKISANYENGVLYITLPKMEKEEIEEKRTIEIS